MKEFSKIQPQALEFESAVLGAAMLESDGCNIAIRLLTKDMFYLRKNALIFDIIVELVNEHNPVDILTVTQKAKHKKQLDEIGIMYITQLTNSVASSGNIEYHCRIIQQEYFRRKIIEISSKSESNAYDDSIDVFELIDYMANQLKELNNFLSTENIKSNNEIIDDVIKDTLSAKEKGGVIGYSSGIPSLDLGLMGLREGLKYVVAALPGVGKTSLVKGICTHLATNGHAGIFFSMEMSKKQLMMSCISQILSLSNEDIQRGNLSAFNVQRIGELKNTLFSKMFFIDDRSNLSPNEMRATVKKYVDEHDIKWIAIDHIGKQKLKGSEHKNKSKENIVSEIASENKNLAKDFNLVVFELSQLTKETNKNQDKRPQLSNLRDSGAIEAEADCVIFIYRPEHHGITELNDMGDSSSGFAELILAKNRFGPPMNLATRYVGAYTKFMAHESAIELQVTSSNNEDVF